ncbi:MAG: acetyl-CoA carboxylase carboxyl transferase subunit alpha [Puniceicoccaceae bacterium 5H]|nr:MAG: acetyl-CoA carboxylase carboxyl transferase subunit alpha [Puniceicoccaceae bacterium 5H]
MEQPEFILEFEKPLRNLKRRLDELQSTGQEHHFDVSKEVEAIERRIEETKREIYQNLTPWQRVQLARHPKRPFALDYIGHIFRDFQELHGDRTFGDDQALIGGTAWFGHQPVMIIAQQKGREVKENLKRNFGMPHPEGYRKALRLMQMAEKFNLPVICFIDTKAAYAGVGSEERHVSEAIARNLREMAHLKTPLLGLIIGEGGSGGALGIAVVDRLLVQQHAYYSVIPPEGCAAILWRSREYSETAANALRLGARELMEQGIADQVVDEPLGGAHRDVDYATQQIRQSIEKHLGELMALDTDTLLEQRYQKYRQMGEFTERTVQQAVAQA